MQSRLLDRNVLVLVQQRSVNDIKQRPNLSSRNHVFVVGPSRARARSLAGGVLHQLSNFFFQGHSVEKGLDPRIKFRVCDPGSARATPDFCRSFSRSHRLTRHLQRCTPPCGQKHGKEQRASHREPHGMNTSKKYDFVLN